MTTKFVGMKDFRQNLSQYMTAANKENVKFIILKKNVPVLEVSPIDEKQYAYTKLRADLDEAEQQIREGKFHSQEEVMKEFGLI